MLAAVPKLAAALVWALVARTGAASFAWIALRRGKTISAAWRLTGAVSTYLVAYRSYSKIIAAKIVALDDTRRTTLPACAGTWRHGGA